jgi:hypothetical protein
VLSFTSVYFSESGLFNGLQPIRIKKFFSASWVTAKLYLTRLPTSFSAAQAADGGICQRKNIAQHFDFCKTIPLQIKPALAGLRFESLGVMAGLDPAIHAPAPTGDFAFARSDEAFRPRQTYAFRLCSIDPPTTLTNHSRNRVFPGAGKIKNITETR